MTEQQRDAIQRLAAGEVVDGYREGGNSMVPKIYSRQPVRLEPVDASLLERGDMVLVKVRGKVYTHLIVGMRPGQVQIGNNHGHVNGWTSLGNVYGIVTEVAGRPVGRASEKVRQAI